VSRLPKLVRVLIISAMIKFVKHSIWEIRLKDISEEIANSPKNVLLKDI
jgi:hypothetical protein